MAIGVFSHVVLGLFVPAQDSTLVLFFGEKYCTGLCANLPMTAQAVETLWGKLCWGSVVETARSDADHGDQFHVV